MRDDRSAQGQKLAVLRYATVAQLRNDAEGAASELCIEPRLPRFSTDHRILAKQLAILLLQERARSRRLLALVAG